MNQRQELRLAKDDLGNRMKSNYEDRTRVMLPRRTWTIIRVDGKAFHTLTKGMKGYNRDLVYALNAAAVDLVAEVQGSLFAYLQSDEVSVVVQDFKDIKTDAWFDGNLQKIVSVAASVVTARFNEEYQTDKFGYFDARAFTIPEKHEVENYLIWRQQDATRNSISQLARWNFAHSACEGKSSAELQDMLHELKGINWNDQPTEFKRGRLVIRTPAEIDNDPPVFTQDRAYLKYLLTVNDYDE